MSQQAALTLNSVVYNPSGSNNGTVYWYDRSGGVAGSFSPLTQLYRTGVGSNKRNDVKFRLVIPIVATSDSACSCAGAALRSSAVNLEFELDPNATAAERTDLYLRAVDLLATALVKSAVEDLNPAYA